jgi:hypothetical protein
MKVGKQMPDHERRERLLNSLTAGGIEGGEVALNVSHLAQAVGMEEAEKLVEGMAATAEVKQSRFSPKGKTVRSGIAVVNRAAAIEAVKLAIQQAARN